MTSIKMPNFYVLMTLGQKKEKKILITFLIKFTCERSNPYSSHLFSSVPKRTNTSGINAKVSYKLINKLITLIFNTIQDALGTNNISSANDNMIPSACDQNTFSELYFFSPIFFVHYFRAMLSTLNLQSANYHEPSRN